MKNFFSPRSWGAVDKDESQMVDPPKTFIETIAYSQPSLARPVSQTCTQNQFSEDAYTYWCEQIREKPRLHRKQWEFCYVAQAFATYGMLAPGRKGIGFGVGSEPLTAVFAARGASVLATDLEPEHAAQIGWVDTNQHALSRQVLNERGICPPELFERNVDFRYMNMNEIPDDLGLFDFNWSACAFEHLGSIEKGCEFVLNAARLLAPGGVAVHTTELNCGSDSETLDHAGTVLFRKRDFEQIAYDLSREGFVVELNFHLGDQPVDQYVDVPPYLIDGHLKLQLEQWVTTSFGLIIRRPF
jgi:2-polyprenyl-3-methyl-5-hydroxy-6-metoxy-1,4-benzoquinol methylase